MSKSKMTNSELDLDIDNYSLDDILELFKIDNIDSVENLARAKMITLKMHPDKSGLDKEYFLFFSKAYKIIYNLHIIQDKTRERGKNSDYDNYKDTLDRDNRIILDKITKRKTSSKEFNEWFNREFEAMKVKDEYTANGYGDWLNGDDEPREDVKCNNKCTNVEAIHKNIEQRKKELYKIVKQEDIMDYNDGGYCDIGNNAPDNYSSGMFSSLAFQDLKQAHTETVIPVDERDADKHQNNIETLKLERGAKINPIDEKTANAQLANKRDRENKYNVQRMYKLLRQQQEVEKNNNEWWKKYKLIK